MMYVSINLICDPNDDLCHNGSTFLFPLLNFKVCPELYNPFSMSVNEL